MSQRRNGLGQSAEDVGQGNPDQEGNGQALNHNKGGMLPAVEISQEAEGDGGQKILKGTALQVVGGCSDDLGIADKEGGQPPPCKEGEKEHTEAEAEGDPLGGKECLVRAFQVPGSHVLGHKAGKGRHKGHGNDGQEYKELLRDSHSCGSSYAQGVDDGGDDQKGQVGEEILKSNGGAYL